MYSIRNRWVLIGLALMIVPSLAMMGAYWSELSDAQACIAASQGFDYRTGQCITGSTIFVPFSTRHPLLVNSGIILSMIGLVACLIGLYRRK
ncbi:hypothetical protein SAMN02745127_03007 [Oceanospirillum multiglobuliferum]|uniref:Uncharacterized protein n=1 Tax=Oceanospirillum multiglobuliferum TaxID=64969 RepID=A0A1T4SEQ7_9GAMM|nr:hypothetical protein [Oceanospirillum multiglobuliferum]OPX54292.1 hypothetical protein BTE48_14965 [Oceanospirillum multiglobuliferum]SKA26800.1 hypothetical protein SAMN02745127_03007 [Oceanospirillum multiglobuliferum]